MLLITNFVEFRVVAGRMRTRGGHPHDVYGLYYTTAEACNLAHRNYVRCMWRRLWSSLPLSGVSYTLVVQDSWNFHCVQTFGRYSHWRDIFFREHIYKEYITNYQKPVTLTTSRGYLGGLNCGFNSALAGAKSWTKQLVLFSYERKKPSPSHLIEGWLDRSADFDVSENKKSLVLPRIRLQIVQTA
jgi:hypothetical protein